MNPAGSLPAVLPIEQDHLPVARERETHPLRIRRRMAGDLADLAAMNGGATREDMMALGWTKAQLVDHFASAIRLAAADAPAADDHRPVKRIRRDPRALPHRPDAGFTASRERRLERAVPLVLMGLCFGLAIVLTAASRPAFPTRAIFPGGAAIHAADVAPRTSPFSSPPPGGLRACAPAREAMPARGLEFAAMSGDRS